MKTQPEEIKNLSNTNFCTECQVHVDGCLVHCPLCGKALTNTPLENELYPHLIQEEYMNLRGFANDLLLFLTLMFIGGSIVLNFIFWQGTPWFIAMAAPVLYTWILVRNSILSDAYIGTKCFLQMLGIMGMMLAFDFVGGWLGWSYEYILPFVLMAGIIYINFYSWIHKSYWRDNIIYAILFAALGFLPLILYANQITHAIVPVVLCTIASGLTVLGILKFTIKHIAGEMKRRFHV